MPEESNQTPSPSNKVIDETSFDDLTEPYRYELLVHCYRLLGSVEDAEDGLQETLLRAWRRLDQLQEGSAFRAWLYKIATNVSLDMLRSRKVRSLPHLTQPSADPLAAVPPPNADGVWLDPLPEFYLAAYTIDPEQRQEVLGNVTLAFLAVLQHLPGRQRAVLLLRDVLDWKAQEVAETLNMTVVAVNSALQRARATLQKHEAHLSFARTSDIDDPSLSALLTQYVQAWETADLQALMTLIHADAKLTMPPLPVWYHGHSHIQTFLDRIVFADRQPGDFRLVSARSNDKPAFVVYQLDETGRYQLGALHILTIHQAQIVQIDDFLALDQPLFARFELPFPE